MNTSERGSSLLFIPGSSLGPETDLDSNRALALTIRFAFLSQKSGGDGWPDKTREVNSGRFRNSESLVWVLEPLLLAKEPLRQGRNVEGTSRDPESLNVGNPGWDPKLPGQEELEAQAPPGLLPRQSEQQPGRSGNLESLKGRFGWRKPQTG